MSKVLLAASLVFVLGGPALAATTKVDIMVGGIDKQIYLPAMLTQRLGYFKQQGLDVTFSSEQSGIAGADALIAGEVQGAIGFYDHTIDLQGRGKELESVVQFSRVPGEVELVSSKLESKVHSFKDLKGMRLGVTGLGASTNFLTKYMAERAGLQVSDVTPVAVGAGNTWIVAMQQNMIQAGMTTEPTVSRALDTKLATILVDLRTEAGAKAALGGTYPAACLYMSRDYVAKHPAVTQKLTNAFVATLHFIATHSAAEIAAEMPPAYYAGDKATYIKALAGGKAMFTPDGVMPADGPPTVLKVLSGFDPAVKGHTIDLSKTYTTTFAAKADAALHIQ